MNIKNIEVFDRSFIYLEQLGVYNNTIYAIWDNYNKVQSASPIKLHIPGYKNPIIQNSVGDGAKITNLYRAAFPYRKIQKQIVEKMMYDEGIFPNRHNPFVIHQKNNIVGQNTVPRPGQISDRKQTVYRNLTGNQAVDYPIKNYGINYRRTDSNKNANYVYERILQNTRSDEYAFKGSLKKFFELKFSNYFPSFGNSQNYTNYEIRKNIRVTSELKHIRDSKEILGYYLKDRSKIPGIQNPDMTDFAVVETIRL
jgi:hypothetical protein